MRHLLTTLGERLTEDEADLLIKEVGAEHNGTINYQSKHVKPTVYCYE